MIPLLVIAELAQPAILKQPPMLDGILLAGVAQLASAELPSGIMDLAEADRLPLPLARVETPDGWWWAASQASLVGPEGVAWAHRRHAGHLGELLPGVKLIDTGGGPDKSLRQPLYYRVEMTRLAWTCIGDPEQVGRALSYIGGIGHRRAHGWGWVRQWTVQPDPDGPTLKDYEQNVRLRHIPVTAMPTPPRGRVALRMVPTRPPYHRFGEAVQCWQHS